MELETIVSEYVGFWCLLGLMLVFFMQCGFAMVETGLTRAKNAGNIIMKNMMDFCLGTVAFMLLGYGLLCGTDIGGFIGTPVNTWINFGELDWPAMVFNLVFCATSATIVSGAMAERTKFLSYCVYSVLISLFVYPIEAHWIWGGGWLSQLGFIDFAGSTAVHMCGGVAAFVGAAILGPRIGKYTNDANGKKRANAIPGHSMTLAALGVFILWFCWYGFNTCAAVTVYHAAQIFATTTIAAAAATIVSMVVTWVKNGKPDVSMTLNGSLAGLVGITAGCANVDAIGALVIGIVCGFLVVVAVEFIDIKLHVDDPVGAVSVHGVCGAVGTIMVGLFDYENGLFYGGGAYLLGVQTLGVVSVIVWVAITMFIIFHILKATIGIHTSAEEEIKGLDVTEHALPSAYPDFMPAVGVVSSYVPPVNGDVAIDEAVPVVAAPSVYEPSATKITKVDMFFNADKFDNLKHALEAIGITGLTVTNVMGCGAQRGGNGYYRGVPVEMNLLPKVQVSVVVSKISPATVIDVAKKALYTGHIGDGKIFVSNIENVVKIRTGETGYDALQD